MSNSNKTIQAQQDYKRLDKCLVDNSDLNRSLVNKLIDDQLVLVNDIVAKKAGMNINCGDTITILSSEPNETIEIKPYKYQLDIKYEDEHIIIVYKPSGMLSHPTQYNEQESMLNALYYYSKATWIPLIVHRLDKDTSGLIIFAKHKEAQDKMLEMFANRTITKKYYALVHKKLTKEHIMINVPISRSSDNKMKMVAGEFKNAKQSLTEAWTIQTWNKYSLLDVLLHTGRTHQIRVHMKYINHPIINDPLYSSDRSDNLYHQYLMAYYLKFINPFDQKQIEIEIDMDQEFKDMIKEIEANNF